MLKDTSLNEVHSSEHTQPPVPSSVFQYTIIRKSPMPEKHYSVVVALAEVILDLNQSVIVGSGLDSGVSTSDHIWGIPSLLLQI